MELYSAIVGDRLILRERIIELQKKMLNWLMTRVTKIQISKYSGPDVLTPTGPFSKLHVERWLWSPFLKKVKNKQIWLILNMYIATLVLKSMKKYKTNSLYVGLKPKCMEWKGLGYSYCMASFINWTRS